MLGWGLRCRSGIRVSMTIFCRRTGIRDLESDTRRLCNRGWRGICPRRSTSPCGTGSASSRSPPPLDGVCKMGGEEKRRIRMRRREEYMKMMKIEEEEKNRKVRTKERTGPIVHSNKHFFGKSTRCYQKFVQRYI